MKAFGYLLCGLFSLAVLPVDVRSQDASRLKRLPEQASLAETQKWLTDSIVKAAGYRTERFSTKAANVKFEACTISFSTMKQSDSIATATMGATKTVTSVRKVVSIDLARIPPAGIFLTGNLYPHLMNIVFSLAGPPTVPDEISGTISSTAAEVVVKKEDAERLREGFVRFAKLCGAQRAN